MCRAFAPTLESIGSARDFVAEVLGASSVQPPIDPALVADVQLVVSELVTNAVSYGSGPAEVALTITTSQVQCSVTSVRHDEPPTLQGVTAPPPSSRTGRGLAIVNALTDSLVATMEDSTWTADCRFDRR